jgi:hypothetical protein
MDVGAPSTQQCTNTTIVVLIYVRQPTIMNFYLPLQQVMLLWWYLILIFPIDTIVASSFLPPSTAASATSSCASSTIATFRTTGIIVPTLSSLHLYQSNRNKVAAVLPNSLNAFSKKHVAGTSRSTFVTGTREMKGNDNDNNKNTSSRSSGGNGGGTSIDVDGMQAAPYILILVLFLCVWNFTIPVEFRRARLCSEQQVLDNPTSKCITVSNYMNGIVQYYQNGGTVFQFDFTIDPDQ